MSRVVIVDQSTSKFTKETPLSVQELACDPCKAILEKYKDMDVQVDSDILSTTADVQ